MIVTAYNLIIKNIETYTEMRHLKVVLKKPTRNNMKLNVV